VSSSEEGTEEAGIREEDGIGGSGKEADMDEDKAYQP